MLLLIERTGCSLLTKLEKNYDLQISFEGAETYHMENYKVVDESTEKEIR